MQYDRIVGPQSLRESGLLQKTLDSLVAPPYTAIPAPGEPAVSNAWSYDGGIVQLGRGDFYGNLILNYPHTTLRGEGQGTIIHGSVLVRAGYCTLDGLTIRGTGQPFAVKLYQAPSGANEAIGGLPRTRINNCLIGATYEGAGDGPSAAAGGGHGLWLDGSIVAEVRNTIFSFCEGSGLFMDTTSTTGKWTTNVNKFYGCTANGNGRFGVEIIGGGMGGNTWFGGNIESNTNGGFSATNCNNVTIRETDFENNKVVGALIVMTNVNTMLVEDCLLSTTYTAHTGTAAADRAMGFSGCVGSLRRNRGTGFVANHDWIAIDPRCFIDADHTNIHTTDDNEDNERRYINNRGGRQ